ncbi:MAG TPA: tetratricopeptide repeat protein [bacterium]|jgi:tetratricopeptide (TPR) repeat protein
MKKTFLLTILLLVVSAGVVLAGMELTSARVYMKQRDWGKALQFYDQAIQKEPDNLEAYEERGELLHTIASDSSNIELAKQVAKDKTNPQMELYERMLSDFKQATTARKPADDGMVKKLKNKIDGVLQKTWTHFYFEALQADTNYIKATSEGKKDPDPKTYLYSALKDLDVAIRLVPERWNSYGFKAQILTKLDSTAASAANWKAAIQAIEASDKEKRETDEYKQGEAIAREALLVDYYNLGRNTDVLTTADAILKTEPENINAIQLKANTLAKLAGDTSLTAARRDSMKTVAVSALENAAKAIKDTASLADIEYTIGQFKLQVADTSGAMSAFENALKYNQGDKDVLFVLGVLYLEGGSHVNTEKARDTFKHITDLYPDHGPAWINYGIALTRLGKTTEGVEAIKKGKALGEK